MATSKAKSKPQRRGAGKSKPASAATSRKPTTRKSARAANTVARAPKSANARGLSAAGLPRPHKNAEIIVRQGFVIDATKKELHAIPEVVFLANADGLDYLSAVFASLAAAARAGRIADAELSVALPRNEHPINVRLSDDIDFRFLPLTTQNRRAMFKRLGIDLASVQKGSLFERYQEVVQQFGRLSGIMRREGLMTAPPAGGPAPQR